MIRSELKKIEGQEDKSERVPLGKDKTEIKIIETDSESSNEIEMNDGFLRNSR
ncbi:hypothetical protein PGTUg99_021901 [Puccinia graminis f. sp. tritici]|uniref:Uncharacterized protein n=1 Tax=Puccinia graminis f. sp. tritici TaxID=56615 RepID=A0A5B0R9C3_PUCGR|nr:hypothetical protein PGTUg99_021901 [Puccinia graminis f. sp. tritici]